MSDQDGTYSYDQEAIKRRSAESKHPIHPILLGRRSRRPMTGTELRDEPETLNALFEAARWAPSHYNVQNWRFVYARRSTPNWEPFLESLWTLNQAWAKNAAVLMAVISKKSYVHGGKVLPLPSHSFEAGSAAMALMIEGTARGLVVHAMGGYDDAKVRQAISLDDEAEYQIEAMIAIGNPDPGAAAEEHITTRHESDKFVCEGTFVEKLANQ